MWKLWLVLGVACALWIPLLVRRLTRFKDSAKTTVLRGCLPSEVAEYVATLIDACPACSNSLKGHGFSESRFVPSSANDQIHKYDQAAREHRWEALKAGAGFEAAADGVAYWFVYCPLRARMGVYRLESKAGYDAKDVIECAGLLNRADSLSAFKAFGPGLTM
jgi:hypothetical protein